jgi:Zn-dependent protease
MMGMDFATAAYRLSIIALPILIAITLHEAAHGFVAWKRGDDTAYMLGRVTFNPLRHIDPIGTVLVPLVLMFASGMMFGWAKPVPVNFRRLNNPRRDMILVAIAGPGINIVLAYVSALLLHLADILPPSAESWVKQNLLASVYMNLLLALFNMIPLPPLDGGRVAVGLLPRRIGYALSRVEPFGFLIIIVLLFMLPQLNLFARLVQVPAANLTNLFLKLAGL